MFITFGTYAGGQLCFSCSATTVTFFFINPRALFCHYHIKRDVEKVRGARDEGSRVELGPGRKAGSGQTTMALLGVGLMCEHARRGLSK